jgi:tetratricopeptide (TPR) repeat protein
MKSILRLTAFLILVVVLPLPGNARPWTSSADDAAVGDPFDPHRIMDLIYAGRPDSALAEIERCRRADPGDPLVLLMRARAMRERLNDEDDDKSLVKEGTKPMHAALDTAITLCEEALEQGDKDPEGYFYRGYAWLNKAQLHVLTRSHWTAGREAARGKKDIERYLERVPDDPDAHGTFGAYLYFADVLPGFFKFLAKLLFIPSGDRERGLAFLHYAAAHDGLFTRDWQMVLAGIEFIFEGNFEEGTEAFIDLCDRYPYYTRFVEPLGVVAPIHPLRMREFGSLEKKAITAHLTLGTDNADWDLIKRLNVHQAFINAYFGNAEDAVVQFAELIEDPPRHPDWVLPIALLNRGFLHQKTGRFDEAREAFETVLSSKGMKYYHGTAKTMLRGLDASPKTVNLNDLSAIGRLYDGEIENAAAALARFKEAYGEDALTDFYSGDLAVFEQDFEAASEAFRRALEREESGGGQIYQMFSSLRLAEIEGQRLRYDDARDLLKHAKTYCHANFLLDFLIRSRKHFYEFLDDGKIDSQPALLVRHQDLQPRTQESSSR